MLTRDISRQEDNGTNQQLRSRRTDEREVRAQKRDQRRAVVARQPVGSDDNALQL
jgi:hypothetical protein